MKQPLLVSVLVGAVILSLACGGVAVESSPAVEQPLSDTRPTATATASPERAPARRYSARLEAHCDHTARCGCEARETCLEGLAAYDRAIPAAVMDCMDGLSCQDVCQQSRQEACIQPHAEQLQANMRSQAAGSYCGRLSQCGCEKSSCEAAFANIDAGTVEFMGCAQQLPCADVCTGESSQLVPGVVAYDACLAPILARMESEHRTNMRIIRSMGGTPTRVIDSSGNVVDQY